MGAPPQSQRFDRLTMSGNHPAQFTLSHIDQGGEVQTGAAPMPGVSQGVSQEWATPFFWRQTSTTLRIYLFFFFFPRQGYTPNKKFCPAFKEIA